MAAKNLTSKELIERDLASTIVALFEVNINFDHYRQEKNRLETKREQLERELARLKKEARK